MMEKDESFNLVWFDACVHVYVVSTIEIFTRVTIAIDAIVYRAFRRSNGKVNIYSTVHEKRR